MSRHLASPSYCPVCGAAVPAGARSCRECGADERAGWNEDETRYDGLDLPEEALDHDEPRRNENFKARRQTNGVSVFWWIVGVILLVVIAKVYVGL